MLNDGLQFIGKLCFHYCPFEEITIPYTVQNIGAEAFSGCYKLK